MRTLFIAACVALAGCAAPADRVTAPFEDLDEHTRYSVSEKPDGFLVAIAYTRYQFLPAQGSVALDCRKHLLSTAGNIATKRARPVKAFEEERIQMGTSRNILTGSTTCLATLPVVWSK